MKIEGKKRKSGSAIVIAFLLMAVVSGTAFAIARLFYLDTSLGGLYENSTVAYYAAESGVEEGLLRYRFDRNDEVAAAFSSSDYINYNDVNRNNLVNGTVGNQETAFGQTEQVYDLNMSYKAKFYGADITADKVLNEDDLADSGYETESEYNVPRDEAVKIDIGSALGPTNSGDMNLYLKLTDDSTSKLDKNQIFVEAKIVGSVGGRLNEFKKALVAKQTTDRGSWSTESYRPMIGISGSDGVYKVNNLRTEISGANKFDNNSGVFLYLKPIGCSMNIGIAPTANDPIASPFTTIKSTGYYGGVGRTLTAKIDRQSGTVYDIFDFVVYQHPKIVKSL